MRIASLLVVVWKGEVKLGLGLDFVLGEHWTFSCFLLFYRSHLHCN